MFWQSRNTENLLYGGQSGSPSPNRRSSIERLQRASRVKNSNILALEQKQEYDPTRLPQIERPLAKVQGNAFRISDNSLLRSSDCSLHTALEFNESGSSSATAMMSAKSSLSSNGNTPQTPVKESMSPTKSSLSPSKFKSSFDHELGQWSANSSMAEYDLPSNRSLHRHAKSVTFDAAPPQINEYEMATPDLSSVGSNSREGSYESVEDDEDDSILYDPAHIGGHEDSFDASLEDTDKTPVVGPDDWRGESPAVHAQRRHDQWESSPAPESSPAVAGRAVPSLNRTGSTTSNGDHRPLPPLPGMGHARSQSTGSTPNSPGLSAAAERMLGSQRSLPSPPPATTSKADIHNIGNKKMTLEERLKLMMLSEDVSGKTAAEQQRERRLRRANGRERFGSPNSEADSTISQLEDGEGDDTVADISLLEDYELPTRISRESIMRRVNGNKSHERESDWNFSSPAPSSSPQRSPTRSPERHTSLDPDVPIPSTEDSMLSGIDEESEGGSVIITRDPIDEEDYDREDSVEYQRPSAEFSEDDRRVQGDDDGSHYSEQDESSRKVSEAKPKEDEIMTPRASSPAPVTTSVPNPLGSIPNLGPSTRMSAFSRDFESYMLPTKSEEEDKENQPQAVTTGPRVSDAREYLQRPYTPEQVMSKPEYDGSGWGEPEDEYADEPGTPESVIHHPVGEVEEETEAEVENEPIESPAIPEQIATIKASGSKLKTRVSNTPADLAAMREARRHVSYEVPGVPPIPEKHRNRLSRDMAAEPEAVGDDFLERHPSFKNRSLTLDLDLGLSMDQDFDRVIESQKVIIPSPFSITESLLTVVLTHSAATS